MMPPNPYLADAKGVSSAGWGGAGQAGVAGDADEAAALAAQLQTEILPLSS